MELTMFPSYLKACKSYISSNNRNTKQSAVANSDGTFAFTNNPKNSDIYLNWIDELLKVGSTISPLDIKANYLYQLNEISITSDESFLNDLELAMMSANITSLHISFNDLRHATEAELAKCLSDPKAFGKLISDRNLMKYGIHNAVAIKLQNPFAKKLFTSSELSELGISISTVQKPIYIYTPIDNSYFMLDDKQVPLKHASLQQQIDISSGSIAVHHNIFYKAHKVYDISQLGLTKDVQYQLLQMEDTQCAFEDIVEFAKKTKIATKYSSMLGINLKSYYEKSSNSIVLDSKLHEDFKISAYIKSLSTAIIENTSKSPNHLKLIEENLLSVNLHSKLGQIIPQKLIDTLSNDFIHSFKISEESLSSKCSLEIILAKVTKATTFASKGISKISLKENLNTNEISNSQNKNIAKAQQSEALTNFLQEI